jgi:hypothetical protein
MSSERGESKRHEAMERVRKSLAANARKRKQSRRQVAMQETYSPPKSFKGQSGRAGAMNVRGGVKKGK